MIQIHSIYKTVGKKYQDGRYRVPSTLLHPENLFFFYSHVVHSLSTIVPTLTECDFGRILSVFQHPTMLLLAQIKKAQPQITMG